MTSGRPSPARGFVTRRRCCTRSTGDRAASSPLMASTSQERPAAIPNAASFAFQTVIKTAPNPSASNHSQSTRKSLSAAKATSTTMNSTTSVRRENFLMVIGCRAGSRYPSQASAYLSGRATITAVVSQVNGPHAPRRKVTQGNSLCQGFAHPSQPPLLQIDADPSCCSAHPSNARRQLPLRGRADAAKKGRALGSESTSFAGNADRPTIPGIALRESLSV